MQTTNHILLVRPASFGYNEETAVSNAFQSVTNASAEATQAAVLNEFETFRQTLANKGIDVWVVEDTPTPAKPDAIFPNNWGSFHEDGRVVLYPMCAPNRRLERREDILKMLEEHFEIKEVLDLSAAEEKGHFLEGTGSIVFDHLERKAYACLSPRTDQNLFVELCQELDYQPIYFNACDTSGQAIYHTNVMMAIGKACAVICLESITNEQERRQVVEALTKGGKTIVEISFEQMNAFAGNMLSLKTENGNDLMVLSQTAYDSLTVVQKTLIEASCELLPLHVNTIQSIGGGSVRCMITEIFLPYKA